MQHRPLVVTSDAGYIDEICGLAAARGIDVHVAADAEGARSRWLAASLVIVGDDQADAIARARLARRRDVVLATRSSGDEPWRLGVEIGVEHVAVLPDANRWLMDRLATSAEPPARDGVVLAIIPASGGAGASTFASTVARCLAQHMRTVLIDADPLGGGLDVLLGLEDEAGIRWPELAQTRGRLGSGALADSLPQGGGVSVLSWTRHASVPVNPEAFAEVLDAAVRGFDAIVIDCARVLDTNLDLTLARSSTAAIVTSSRVRSVVAAARLFADIQSRTADIRLVVRSDAKGLSEDAIAMCVGVRESLRLPHSQRIPLCADAGELVPLRDPYGRACTGFIWEWARVVGRAA